MGKLELMCSLWGGDKFIKLFETHVLLWEGKYPQDTTTTTKKQNTSKKKGMYGITMLFELYNLFEVDGD